MSDALPQVRIQIVVRNGERFIRHCLDAVRAQTYANTDVVILDNASTDGTRDIMRHEYSAYRLIEHPANLGMWPGHEHLLRDAAAPYVLCLSVDVLLDPDFVAVAVAACEADPEVAAVQGKFYQYTIGALEAFGPEALERRFIDTCGFSLTRSRKVVNIGHGAIDGASYQTDRNIFGVEGAAPFFRRSALEQCRIEDHLWDPDYFWYGDDLDFAWRMTLLGHRQRFVAGAVAWHDRSTTKGAAAVPVLGQLKRLAARRGIPLLKRRLDWSNTRFTILKNEYIINLFKDLPWVLAREMGVFVYTVLFEFRVFAELPRFLRLMPAMLRRRREVMRRATASPEAIHHWFT